MEKVDYTSILADIDAKIGALESARESIKAARASGALGPQSDIPESGSGYSLGVSYELPRGALLGKSIPAAIKLYLDAIKKKQTIKQIAQALKEGGVESTSDNFDNIITGSLNRLKVAKEVLRFKDGWGLSEQYPGHLRKALSQDQKSTSTRANKRKRTASSKKTKNPRAARPANTKGKSEGLEQRIYAVLSSDKTKSFSAKEIAKHLQIEKAGAVSLALGRMAAKGKAKKCGSGMYQAPSVPMKEVLSAV